MRNCRYIKEADKAIENLYLLNMVFITKVYDNDLYDDQMKLLSL